MFSDIRQLDQLRIILQCEVPQSVRAKLMLWIRKSFAIRFRETRMASEERREIIKKYLKIRLHVGNDKAKFYRDHVKCF